MISPVVDLIKASWNATDEVDALLGPGKGAKRSCWNKANHQDRGPSLTFSPRSGGWKCHACGETGDLFTLAMKVKGLTFPQAIAYYCDRLGVTPPKTNFKSSAGAGLKSDGRVAVIDSPSVISEYRRAVAFWTEKPDEAANILGFLAIRYGITVDTVLRWGIGWSSAKQRLVIPVPQWEWPNHDDRTAGKRKFVNLRYHDVLRVHCDWYQGQDRRKEDLITLPAGQRWPEGLTLDRLARQDLGEYYPVWPPEPGRGKVVGVAKHNGPYLYPAQVLDESPMVYLVGGENKALMLLSLGIPAVSFTNGEGNYSEFFLPYFQRKQVRVIMDADPGAPRKAGKSSMDIAAEKLADVLLGAGAQVQVCHWPGHVLGQLPPKGDITDWMFINKWDVRALDELTWTERNYSPPPYTEQDEAEDEAEAETEIPAVEEMVRVPFAGLVSPKYMNTWVRVMASCIGQADAPFAVPITVVASCKKGQTSRVLGCQVCILPKCGFQTSLQVPLQEQMELLGSYTKKWEVDLPDRMGIPPCKHPKFSMLTAAVQLTALAPTMDVAEGWDPEVAPELRGSTSSHHSALFFNEGTLPPPVEGGSYDIWGKITQHPKTGTFAFAAKGWRPTTADVFSYTPNKSLEGQLYTVLGDGKWDARRQLKWLLRELQQTHCSSIQGQSGMLLSMLIAFFQPLSYKLGSGAIQYSGTMSSQILIMGDTGTGKSTMAAELVRLYGAGGWQGMDTNPTMAGLMGGMAQWGKGQSMFVWGAIPAANRGLLVLDEYNKAPHELIANWTSLISRGICQRSVVGQNRTIEAKVRYLLLANPRTAQNETHTKRLSAYANPMDAISSLYQTAQDMRRVELVHIQRQLVGHSHLSQNFDAGLADPEYSRELAKHHLSWAWTRQDHQWKFEDISKVQHEAIKLSAELGDHLLLLPQQAIWKVTRLAAALAALLFSRDHNGNVLVTLEHSSMAVELLRNSIEPYLHYGSMGGKASGLPTELLAVFDHVKDYKRLRRLTLPQPMSYEDLRHALGGDIRATATVQNALLHEYAWLSLSASGMMAFTMSGRREMAPLVEQYLTSRAQAESQTETEPPKARARQQKKNDWGRPPPVNPTTGPHGSRYNEDSGYYEEE